MTEFRKLAGEADWREEDQIEEFIRDLKTTTKIQLNMRYPETIEEAIQTAGRKEQSFEKPEETRVGKSSFMKSSGDRKFKGNGKKYKGKGRQGIQGENKCYNCGEDGHFSKECKENLKFYKCHRERQIASKCRIRKERRLNLAEAQNDQREEKKENKKTFAKRKEVANMVLNVNLVDVPMFSKKPDGTFRPIINYRDGNRIFINFYSLNKNTIGFKLKE